MYIVGVGLGRPLQPWDILLIYCNNQLKKYITPFSKTSERGTLHPPSDVYVRSFSVPLHTLIKLCYTKALEWSSLVPGPEAKSSSEITNPASFTISCHYSPLRSTTKLVNIITRSLPGTHGSNSWFHLALSFMFQSHHLASVLYTVSVCVCDSRSVVSDSLWPHGL